MQDYYQILGLNHSATADEIRRAYRILARRYHPDVNPGKSSEDKFKQISEAYRVLSDAEKKRIYDMDIDEHLRVTASSAAEAYRRVQRTHGSARKKFQQTKHQNFGRVEPVKEEVATAQSTATHDPISDFLAKAKSVWTKIKHPTEEVAAKVAQAQARQQFQKATSQVATNEAIKRAAAAANSKAANLAKISVVEVSLTIRDAIMGVRKAIEIAEPEGPRKISVGIPAGVRNGSVVHLRSKNTSNEDLVVVVRVASHPFLSIHPRGVVAEVPITINEAISGASISVPTLDQPMIIKIPPGSQSGSEIRLKGLGAQLKDGSRGDLIVRLMIYIPTASNAVGIKEKAKEIDLYYDQNVRANLPKNWLEL